MKLWLHLLWVCTLSACALTYDRHVPVESSFPLKRLELFSTDDVIKRIAVSNTWIAVYASGAVTAIDIETRKTLWEINLEIEVDDRLAFLIVDDVLVATSKNQVWLVDKTGQTKQLRLESPAKDTRDILRVAAVYPGQIYINRFPDWQLEAYSIARDTRLWALNVGRGSTDVFYDVNTDVAYITTRYKSIYAIDNTTGEVLWQHDESTLSTTYEDDVIYAIKSTSSSDKIRLFAFDAKRQVEIWQNEITFSKYVYTMAVLNDLVIVGGDEGLLAVNKDTGAVMWQTPRGESFMSQAVEYGDMIYAKGVSHTVYAISPQNGNFVGFVSLERSTAVEPMYNLVSGVYKLKNGIVFNTRHAVMMYQNK